MTAIAFTGLSIGEVDGFHVTTRDAAARVICRRCHRHWFTTADLVEDCRARHRQDCPSPRLFTGFFRLMSRPDLYIWKRCV